MKIGVINFEPAWYFAIEHLDYKAKAELYNCIFHYIYDQIEDELETDSADALWILIKKDIENQYENTLKK